MKDSQPDSRQLNSLEQELFDYLQDMLQVPSGNAVTEASSSRIEPKLVSQQPSGVAEVNVTKIAPSQLKSDSVARSVKAEPAVESRATLSTLLPPTLLTPQLKTTSKTETGPPLASDPKLVVAPEPEIYKDESPPDACLEVPEVADQFQSAPDRGWLGGRPAWAQSRFECLIFNVAGLKLAVPLVCLGAIHEIGRRFNHLPGQCDWFIGILQTPNAGNIKVLDTALCIMPERYNTENRDGLQYVITLHGYEWGLACHSVEQSITLEPEQVKWRTHQGSRPWLAGTVVDQMCSLIDTEGFRQFINQAEQTTP